LFSQTESFPNAILEYYTFKLPILAYDTGDIKKLVNQKNGKVFKSRDPKVISRIIKNLYLDKNLKMKSHNSYLNLEKYSNKEKNLLHFSKIINKSLCVE
jgi:glycosyltransferase involved in cell wall biosynthesis